MIIVSIVITHLFSLRWDSILEVLMPTFGLVQHSFKLLLPRKKGKRVTRPVVFRLEDLNILGAVLPMEFQGPMGVPSIAEGRGQGLHPHLAHHELRLCLCQGRQRERQSHGTGTHGASPRLARLALALSPRMLATARHGMKPVRSVTPFHHSCTEVGAEK